MLTMGSDIIEQNAGVSLQGGQDHRRAKPAHVKVWHALLANLKHELRNTLNAIIGFSEILLEDTVVADTAGQAGILNVNQTGKQILAAIDDVLDPDKIAPNLSKPDLQKIWGSLHDRLKTKLNDLVSQADILLEDARKAERQSLIDNLQIIYASAKHLKEIVESLAFPAGVANVSTQNPASGTDRDESLRETTGVFRSLESPGPPAGAVPQGIILVVDDDEANRGLLCSCLKRDGHTIISAENGCRAIDLLALHDFDLVLLDVIMPQMNGYQVLREMRSSERLQKVPVIMISAFNEADISARCIEIGAEEYLIKPFDKHMLRARVNACLQKKMERDKTVRELSTSLDSKSSQLDATAEELGASRRKIELLEEETVLIQTAVEKEIEKIRRISIFDILMMIGCGLILGFLFNAANPGGVRIIPQTWSAEPSPLADLDSAKAKFDAKSALFIDARPSEYFQQDHIPGAVSLPNALFDFIYMMKLAGIDPETEIIIYGRDISRLHDEEAALRLRSRGHRNIRIMVDGLPAWQKKGYPLEK